MEKQYELLNKDIVLLDFICQDDGYGGTIPVEQRRNDVPFPLGYKNLESFLERRKAPKHRKHIQELLRQYGCDELEGFLDVTHALSLNDTFWVREKGSSLCWADVSLYQNEFNDLIAQAAFDGQMGEPSLSTTSPEFGTDGLFAKCWVREDNGIFLYKSGSVKYELEPLSEFLATQIAACICDNYVPYDMKFHHGKLVSTCKLFTSESVGLAKAADFLPAEQRSIPNIMSLFQSIGAEDDLRRMFVLDAIILNIDRHMGNFGVSFDTESMQILGAAPEYDNNRSLLFDLDDDQLQNYAWYIPHYTPRIGTSFVGVAKGMMTDAIRQDIKNLRGFEFQQHPAIDIPKQRLQILSEIINLQVKTILNK